MNIKALQMVARGQNDFRPLTLSLFSADADGERYGCVIAHDILASFRKIDVVSRGRCSRRCLTIVLYHGFSPLSRVYYQPLVDALRNRKHDGIAAGKSDQLLVGRIGGRGEGDGKGEAMSLRLKHAVKTDTDPADLYAVQAGMLRRF